MELDRLSSSQDYTKSVLSRKRKAFPPHTGYTRANCKLHLKLIPI